MRIRNIYKFFAVTLVFAVFQQCAPTKTISTQGGDNYSEELYQYRIQYADSIAQVAAPVEPSPERMISSSSTLPTPYAVTTDISQYFNGVDDLNRDKNRYQGFTLQVYTGNSRDEANEAKLKVYEALPEAEPKVGFNTIWRTKVGEYTTRLEAQSDYAALTKVFPNVLLVPEIFRVVN